MLLNIPQCTVQPLTTKNIWPQITVVLRSRKPTIESLLAKDICSKPDNQHLVSMCALGIKKYTLSALRYLAYIKCVENISHHKYYYLIYFE